VPWPHPTQQPLYVIGVGPTVGIGDRDVLDEELDVSLADRSGAHRTPPSGISARVCQVMVFSVSLATTSTSAMESM
jgi:hypothetical protein